VKKYQLTALFLIFSSSFTFASTCDSISSADIVGTAYSENDEYLYCEYYSLDSDGNKLVQYADVDGNLIAEKKVTLGYSPQQPSVRQIDFRSGELRSAEVIYNNKIPQNALLNYLKNEESEKRTFNVDITQDLVIDSGFDYAIRQSLQRIQQGEDVRFKFLSFTDGKSYSLIVHQTKLSRCRVDEADANHQCVKVKPANALARLLVKPIYLLYNMQENELLRFMGRVNITDDDGKSQWAMIDYQYN
jgi:hypothetical protein